MIEIPVLNNIQLLEVSFVKEPLHPSWRITNIFKKRSTNDERGRKTT